MTRLYEQDIEEYLLQLLQNQGYKYFHGSEFDPYTTDTGKRENFSSVVLEKELRESLQRINPEVPESALSEAVTKILNLGGSDLMANNEKFHKMLTDGVIVEYFADGETKNELVKLIDLKNIENNSFWVVNQFEIKENNNHRIPDVVIFVNGLPLVLMELKNPTDEKATLENAYTQIQNYKKAIPSIFHYNALCVISDGLDARVSSLSAPFSRFLAWRGPKEIQEKRKPELETLATEMLKKDVLLKLIRFNTVFETEEVKDKETGIIKQVLVKKVAAYHQYYAVEKAVESTLQAIHTNHKIGVVWHTQGSGKSLSMVFFTGRLMVNPQMHNPTIVVITDRNDLDDQLFTTFSNCSSLLREKPKQAQSRAHLKKLLNVAGGGIIFTTIQKFYPDTNSTDPKDWEKLDVLTDRNNVVVIADEAHRSHYGFKARVIETESGAQTRYGNAKYLRDALPNASFIGFTGTPIELEDRSTKKVFGDYIDIYDIQQSVTDKATVPISYESRLIKIKFDKSTARQIDQEIAEISNALPEQIEKAKRKLATISSVVGAPERLADLAKDIVEHFEKRQETLKGKGMIVVMTREIAVDLYDQIIKIRPDWHNENLMKGKIKVVMTSSSDDPAKFQPHRTSKNDRAKLAVRFKDINDELELVIVQSMWLTGFDVPPLHTMYIDKKMQGANLMQAIARVNRVYRDKPGGLIVDYIGIGQDLKNAMSVYTESGGKGEAVTDQADVIAVLKEKFEIVEQMLYGFDWKRYFKASPEEKLQILLDAEDFILKDENRKKRFISEVGKLSKLFAMAVPSAEAEALRESVAFFQAVKSHINKFTKEGFKTDRQVQLAVKQIVDEALSTSGVIDVFQMAGIDTPRLDILSEEFLLEVKKLKQKNVAFELLKKLLSDEINVRKRKNIIQSKKFSEMLESVIKAYHNNQISAAQVIEELSNIAKEIKIEDKKAEELGLTEEEYAFYTILKENKSTTFLKDEIMQELIHKIVETIRKNATIDWEKRSDVRAKLCVTVKKLLMRYGYPPDLARMEADRVLEQGEALAEKFV